MNATSDIPGYFGRYQVNVLGQILKNGKPMMRVRKHGKCEIRLTDENGKRHTHQVHKIVAQVFLKQEPGPDMVLYHKNGDLEDNCVNNLAWINKRELGKKTGAMAKRKTVLKLDSHGDIVHIYTSARAASRDNFMSYQAIIDRCNGKVKSEYAPDGYRYVWDSDFKY